MDNRKDVSARAIRVRRDNGIEGVKAMMADGLERSAARLTRQPARYLDFGAFWWTWKRLLRQAGFDFGPTDDVAIRAKVEFPDDLEDYVASLSMEMDLSASPEARRTSEWPTEDGRWESYELTDPDMERQVAEDA